MTVLIAGADDEFRHLVRQSLGRGVRVIGDVSGIDEAVTLTARLRPDVVLLEVPGPLIDGPAAARRIKDGHAGAKVILLTSGPRDAASDGPAAPAASKPDALLSKDRVVGEMLSPLRTRPRAAARRPSHRARTGG